MVYYNRINISEGIDPVLCLHISNITIFTFKGAIIIV